VTAVIINDVTILIARIEVISRLKREGGVNQVKIRVIDSKTLATRVECRFDPFRPMIWYSTASS